MRIATWNVNSVLVRVPRLVPWLEAVQPDVLCLQETKCSDDQFPTAAVSALGYEVAVHGDGRWNGVALLSRVGITDVIRGLRGDQGFESVEARAIGATCGGLRMWSVYVPNGREVGHPHYAYKLRWLATLRHVMAGELQCEVPLALCGDFNIAPTDDDVWDPKVFEHATHVTPAERDGLAALRALGLQDVVPRALKYDRPFTYWDYRAGNFHKNMGMRIDLVYASAVVAAAVTDAYVDRDARKGTAPSDHAPVVVDL
jgi:exodeoxyribonuclease-3